MLDQGFNVLVLQPGESDEIFSSHLQPKIVSPNRLKKVFRNPLLSCFYIFKIFWILRKSNAHVIHTQAQVSFLMVSLLRKLRFISRRKFFVHTERGIFSKYNFVFRHLFIFFMSELDKLICTTETNKRLWEDALRVENKKVDVEVISNTAGDKFPCNKQKGKKKGVTVGFSGRFCDWKNWPLAENITAVLNSEIAHLNVKMAVGCLDDKSLVSTAKMFSRLKSLLGDRFIGEVNVSLSEMGIFYNDIDFFILTSNPGAESFGRTVVEAMSSGCIVFVTEGGGPPEVLGDQRFVFSSVDSLVTEILKIIDNEYFASQISERNVMRANELFSVDANIDKHINMYLGLGVSKGEC